MIATRVFGTLIGAALLGVVVIIVSSQIPDEVMPRDPFENDELRVVTCRIDWDTTDDRPVALDVYCLVGDDEHDEAGVLNTPWVFESTGTTGTEVFLVGVPSRSVTTTCVVLVDGDEIGRDESEPGDEDGCNVTEVIP